MTVITGDVNVSAVKLEIGLYVVIENPQVPGDRTVAGIALSGEIPAVRVVVFVAVGANAVDVFERLGLVAVLAFVLTVYAQ